jgi:ABC-type molybdate transport system substrate-binding protein
MSTSKQREAAQAFAGFMRSQTVRTILQKKGFDPI